MVSKLLRAKEMATINETDARLNSHEAVCALRYESINARLKRLEQILMGTAAFIIASLLAIVFKI
jgi:hypothetical protein